MPLHRVPKGTDSRELAAVVRRLERDGHTITYVGETSLEWVVVSTEPGDPGLWRDRGVEERAA